MRLKGQKPPISAYPRELQTWGDRLRKRRLELGLLQKQVACRLGVDAMTVVNWELNRTAPSLRFGPRIIHFLGYAPYDPSSSPSERLRTAREAVGLSQKRLAQALGVDEDTVAQWERGRKSPGIELAKKITRLLKVLSA
ncbi:MAG: helix-turn-helix domain-containing protein [Myxococcota bacterium]